jgi:1,4-alpha-glucan branching enzyme
MPRKPPAYSGVKSVDFRLRAEPGSSVFVAGTFNDWSPADKPLKCASESGMYLTSLYLPKGRYEYKFVVNGEWCVDAECPGWAPNSLGSLNSVLEVA